MRQSDPSGDPYPQGGADILARTVNRATHIEVPPGRTDVLRPSLRVLYVTGGFPYPLTTGQLRHYFLIKELARRHAVTLLSIVGRDFVPAHAEALTPFTTSISTFASAAGSESFARKVATRIGSALPIVRARSPVGRLAEAGAHLTHDDFDVVFFSGKHTHRALSSFRALPVAVDLCDAASRRVLGNMRVGAPARMPILLAQYLELRHAERRLAKGGDHLFFASARDRAALLGKRSGPGRTGRATVLPNGVDAWYWRRESRELGQREIVFTGAMDWPPNEDAALHLVQDIMPLVQESVPEATLSIVGRSATARLRSAAARAGVTVTGFVEDVRPYLERASVFAAPLRFGAGIQNKLLEAMAMEVPVVASPLAADGLRSDDGRDPPLLVAAEPDEFASRLVERLLAAERDSTTDVGARRFVEAEFSWERSGVLLEDVLISLVRTWGEDASATRPRGRSTTRP